MKFWRTYDGLITLSWLCTVALVGSIREVSLPDDMPMVQLAYGVMLAGAALVVLVLYQLRNMKRRRTGSDGLTSSSRQISRCWRDQSLSC